MRTLALIAIVGAGLTLGGVAIAGPYVDPGGRMNFNAPPGWTVDPQINNTTSTSVLTFDGGHDCYLFGVTNSTTASSTPGAVIRAMREPIPAAAWVGAANSVHDFFPSQSAQLSSQTVDTSGVWPVQRAQFQSDGGVVFAAMQSRPGVDLMAFCRALGAASTAPFEALFASISHPGDAVWLAQAEGEPH